MDLLWRFFVIPDSQLAASINFKVLHLFTTFISPSSSNLTCKRLWIHYKLKKKYISSPQNEAFLLPLNINIKKHTCLRLLDQMRLPKVQALQEEVETKIWIRCQQNRKLKTISWISSEEISAHKTQESTFLCVVTSSLLQWYHLNIIYKYTASFIHRDVNIIQAEVMFANVNWENKFVVHRRHV